MTNKADSTIGLVSASATLGTGHLPPLHLLECYDFMHNRHVANTSSMNRRSQVDSYTLSRQWGISEPLAMKTLDSTTQQGWRYIEDQFTRRFRTRQAHMQYHHLRTGVFTDTLFNDTTSVRGNNCAQLFVTDDGHSRIYPLSSKGQAFDKLDLYCSTVGIPLFLVSVNAGEETGSDWERVQKKYLFQQRTTESHSPRQNRAE